MSCGFQRCPVLIVLLAVGHAACSSLLNLSEPRSEPNVCSADDDCPPGSSCTRFQCLAQRCVQKEARCNGLAAERCDMDGHWIVVEQCSAACERGDCATPPSCRVGNPQCSGTSCCGASVVDGGRFDLHYQYAVGGDASHEPIDEAVPRTVRSFILDRFEVTWGRFAEFVFSYEDETQRPQPGAGKLPGFPASGWRESWSDSPNLVPDSQRALENMLDRAGQPITSETVNADIPVRGINWYVALAFCIWDGGRLPTEAEWAYAAVGGEHGTRLYPWTSRDLDTPITHQDARYSDEQQAFDEPGPVGASSGRGAFGQDDLAGNVAEWVADVYEQRLAASCSVGGGDQLDEHECVTQGSGTLRVQRGGSHRDGPTALRNTNRGYGVPERVDQPIGIRCARDMPRSTAAH